MTTEAHTPRGRVELLCRQHGAPAVADACMRLVAGRELDPLMRAVFGDAHTEAWLDSDVNAYWLRVWGVRGLLWNWDRRALATLRSALLDDAWRVREMSAKVVARHLVDDLQPEVAALAHDPVPRVRAAASRALALLSAAGSGR